MLLGVVAPGLATQTRPSSSETPVAPPIALGGHLRGHDPVSASASWTAWPQALRDAQHTGGSEHEGPVSGRVRWTRRLEGNVTPGPVVAADGTIYAATNAGVLHAIDPRTGKDRWTLDGGGGYGLDLSTSPAVLPNGIVLWPGPGERLRAVSPMGRLLWQLPLDGQVTSPAVTAAGYVVVGDATGRLLGLQPTGTGPAVQWEVALHEQTYGSPVLSADGSTTYQSVLSGVVAVRHGALLWRSTAPTEIVEVSPAVAPDGTVVIGTNDPYEYGLDPETGQVRWRFRRGHWTYSSPGVTADGVVYFGDHANQITGLDAVTGRLIFRFAGTQRRPSRRSIGIWTAVLSDVDHRTYVGTRQGFIYGVDRAGRLLWQLDTGATVDSYPALTADGALIVGVTDGRLLAIADS